MVPWNQEAFKVCALIVAARLPHGIRLVCVEPLHLEFRARFCAWPTIRAWPILFAEWSDDLIPYLFGRSGSILSAFTIPLFQAHLHHYTEFVAEDDICAARECVESVANEYARIDSGHGCVSQSNRRSTRALPLF